MQPADSAYREDGSDYTVLFLYYSHSCYHRNTGIKVNSSDINTDVYGSDQNRPCES